MKKSASFIALFFAAVTGAFAQQKLTITNNTMCVFNGNILGHDGVSYTGCGQLGAAIHISQSGFPGSTYTFNNIGALNSCAGTPHWPQACTPTVPDAATGVWDAVDLGIGFPWVTGPAGNCFPWTSTATGFCGPTSSVTWATAPSGDVSITLNP